MCVCVQLNTQFLVLISNVFVTVFQIVDKCAMMWQTYKAHIHTYKDILARLYTPAHVEIILSAQIPNKACFYGFKRSERSVNE